MDLQLVQRRANGAAATNLLISGFSGDLLEEVKMNAKMACSFPPQLACSVRPSLCLFFFFFVFFFVFSCAIKLQIRQLARIGHSRARFAH